MLIWAEHTMRGGEHCYDPDDRFLDEDGNLMSADVWEIPDDYESLLELARHYARERRKHCSQYTLRLATTLRELCRYAPTAHEQQAKLTEV